MTVFGISMVKDEADIIERTISHMREQVDEIIVADNGSTDGTREILESFDILVLDDPEPAYYQSKKMTNLARIAHDGWADWVVPFDADEIWYSPHGSVKSVLQGVPLEFTAAKAVLYNHVATPDAGLPWRRIEPGVLPKVACRTHESLVIEPGNHGVHYEFPHLAITDLLYIRHFPYRSFEQFLSKVRNGSEAYKSTNLPEHIGAHWRGYGRILEAQGEEGLKQVFYQWFYSEFPDKDSSLIYDPAPGAP